MSDRWAAKSKESQVQIPVSIVNQISQLPNTVKRFKNWVFNDDWEQDLFDQLSQELPMICAYSFTKDNEKRYYAIIHNPSSENIFRLIECFYNFLDMKREKDDAFYCEFLVFGEEEEKYLGIPQDARRLTSSLEADYAGKNRTLVEVHA